MSDSFGAGVSGGFIRTPQTQNGASRASQGPVPVNSSLSSGTKGFTATMRQHRAREAHSKAEKEAREKAQDQIERRLQLEQDSQAYSACAVSEKVTQRRPIVARHAESLSVPPGHSGGLAVSQQPAHKAEQQGSTASQLQSDAIPFAAHQRLGQQQQQVEEFRPTSGLESKPGISAKRPSASQPQQELRRVPFPHAFERWENLSSHWEGLTSYWIRKLEQNNDALEKDPISQQMARQVTDLSAAGANLFHAVVELQRLRASSERKFQRWFFDTRAELERAKEIQGDLEGQVKAERQARVDTLALLQKTEDDKVEAENLLKDIRRELRISKEEARRAWEELGRREQEERDRTTSLRNGDPTLVGGVQVIPMIQGLPTRQSSTSRPQTRAGPYPGGPEAIRMSGSEQILGLAASTQYYDGRPEPPTVVDPYIEGTMQPIRSIPDVQDEAHSFFEQGKHNVYAPVAAGAEVRLYSSSSEGSEQGEEDHGHYQGQRGLPASHLPKSDEGDDYDHRLGSDGHYEDSLSSSTSGPPCDGQVGSIDYSGSGWGMPTGWESAAPRHRHPTRLSDVIEEDERSRATPSRTSQSSREVC